MRLRLQAWLRRRSTKGLVLLGLTGVTVILMVGGGVYAVLGGVGTPQTASDIELQRGLAGWWKMDGNAKDSTPYGDSGTVTGATLTTDRKGAANSAYGFSSTTDNIAVPTNSALNSSVFTFSAWVKPTSASNIGTIIGSNGNGGPQFRIETDLSINLLKQNIAGVGSHSTTALTLNAWNHVAVTYDASGNYVYYVNGLASGSGTNLLAFSFTNYILGKKQSNLETLVGSLSDVRTYSRVLSANEIKALYNQYNAKISAASGENGLVGWWKMDGNAKDSTPYGDNGTLNGAPSLATDRKGTANSAYSFNGTSQSISVPTTNLPASKITVSAWVNQSTKVNWYDIVPNNWGGAGLVKGWDLYTDSSGTAIFGLWNNTETQFNAYCNSALTTNSWHLITGTFDGTTVRAYFDGVLCGITATPTGSLTLSTTNQATFRIGEVGGGSSTHSVDDVRIYNRALSGNEITNMYKSYNPQINLNSSPTNTSTVNINAGLVAYWPFNGNAKDVTPYSNNGVLSGTAALAADRKAIANKAMIFGSAVGAVTVPDASVLNFTNSFSISAWTQSNASDAVYDGFIGKYNGGGSGWDLGIHGGKPRMTTRGSSGIDTNAVGSSVYDTAWHHIVAVCTLSSIKIYEDNVLINTTNGTWTPVTNNASLTIGNRAGSNQYTGTIDDVRLYNRALSAIEVQALYSNYY
jgi:hypothetical protein